MSNVWQVVEAAKGQKRPCSCLFQCLAALLTALPAISLAGQPFRDRAAFTQAMNRVIEGMSEAKALALVGKPDDVSTAKDWRHCDCRNIREIWRYGTAGHN